ncbi:MAG: S41 family peptidase [Planctomycetes bacterium]|nr:S41 family peptidase [Planctomycetota bacterium]
MSQQPRLPLWFLVANWLLLVIAFVAGSMLGSRHQLPNLPEPQATALEVIHAEILKSHVEQQDGNALLDRAIAAMVGGLDEYSRYVPPAKVASYVEESTGRYEGVGMVMSQQGEDLVVLYPFVGSPAEKGGLLPGDRILTIDGKPVAELPMESRSSAANELVRGPADSDVRLQVARAETTAELTVHRGPVQIPVVKWAHLADPEQRLGYVFLSDFYPGVATELASAIAALGKDGGLRGLILDLRFDGGGSLDECIDIANLFLPSGVIVSTRRRDQLLEEFKAEAGKCRFPDLPLVLLVNERSASASEVLAGAMQDHERAAIVGVRTYGKGYVNTVYTWKNMPFRLKLTTAHYYTPKGRNIDRPHARHGATNPDGSPVVDDPDAGGIVPDVVAAIDPSLSSRIEERLVTREPPAPYLEAFRAVAATYKIPVPEPPTAAEDSQLAAALQTLRERAGKQSR